MGVKLEAGQWYRDRSGGIRYCIGASMALANRGDKWVIEDQDGRCGVYHNDGAWIEFEQDPFDIIEHMPDCTGFDWVPPPKLQLREGAWYERKDGVVVGPCEPKNGPVFPWMVGEYFYRHDGTNNTEPTFLIREVDPPQPKYRPFKNAEEFKPFRDCWWYRDDNGTRRYFPPQYYDDKCHGGVTFVRRFETCFFEDGTPFGVIDGV